MSEHRAQLDRLWRRVLMTIMPVKITATDDSGPVHRAQVRGFPSETIDAMPVMQLYGVASHAPPGSDAMAVFLSGDRSNGVIVGTGHQASRLRNLPVAGVALYDNSGTVVTLDAAGNIAITCKGTVTVNCPDVTVTAPDKVSITTPLMHVEGNITTSGNITADGDINGANTP
jgi:phage baseplate assembly protein V